MTIFNNDLPGSWRWAELSDHFTVTKKPYGTGRATAAGDASLPFIPMAAVPAGGAFAVRHELRPAASITSGNYFERGDLLLSRITPSFENLKQAIATDVPGPYGYASTELIPLQAINELVDIRFLFFYLLHNDVRSLLVSRMEGATGRQRVPESALLVLRIPCPPILEQRRIVAVLTLVQRAIAIEEDAATTAREVKRVAMEKIFSGGLRGDSPCNSDAGPVPSGWEVGRLDMCCKVVSSSLSYTDLESMAERNGADAVPVMGIKVSDMNTPGNEVEILSANITRQMPLSEARRRAIPPGAIVFPKRGAAIATNKKRIATAWTILDPNLIAVEAGDGVDPRFLHHWFQRFDLRTITEPGPTPQLNKKNLVPLLIARPPTKREQAEVARVLDSIDRVVAVHDRKRATLGDLFAALLDKLMTGEIRVDKLDIDTSEVAAA